MQTQSPKQTQLSHQKPTSEKGASTNLSQTSNESFDEELGHKKGQKFEFINQEIKEWPQWSVNERKEKEEQDKKKEQIESLEIVHKEIEKLQIDDYMFNRGFDYPIPQDILEQNTEVKKVKKESTFDKVVGKIKKWFN